MELLTKTSLLWACHVSAQASQVSKNKSKRETGVCWHSFLPLETIVSNAQIVFESWLTPSASSGLSQIVNISGKGSRSDYVTSCKIVYRQVSPRSAWRKRCMSVHVLPSLSRRSIRRYRSANAKPSVFHCKLTPFSSHCLKTMLAASVSKGSAAH